jgi:hypothetical protein
MADIVVKEIRLLDGVGGHKSVSPAEFLAMPTAERIKLILAAKVQFYDGEGKLLPAMEAVKTLKA